MADMGQESVVRGIISLFAEVREAFDPAKA